MRNLRRDTTITLSEARAVNPCRFDLAAQLAAGVLGAALRQRGRRLDFREVFDREQLSMAFDDPNSNDIHIRIKKVLAMIRRLHPLIADAFGIGALGHILGERNKIDARVRGSRGEGGLARELMRKRILSRHRRGVLSRGLSQRRVPFQARDSLSPTRLIRSIEDLAFHAF
jgi:hypothetical protein